MLLLIAVALPCTPEALESTVEQADTAIGQLNPSSLGEATGQLFETLDCLEQPLDVTAAANVHRVLGIHAFVTGDEEATDRWFAAARALEPTLPLGHSIGGPIEAAWARASTPIPPDRTDLAAPRRGMLFIDGQTLRSHPTHLPWVFQHVDGERVTTAIVQPGTRPPRYPGDQPPEIATRRRGKPLTVMALTAVGLGAAGIGGAAWTRSQYKQQPTDDPGLLVANRALGIGGYALGATGLGLGVAAVVGGEW